MRDTAQLGLFRGAGRRYFRHPACFRLVEMADNIIVMPGTARLDCSPLYTVAKEFGWKVELAEDPDRVEAIGARGNTRAILFHRDAFGPGYSWREAIRLLRATLPGAYLVVLNGFSEPVDWQELTNAGAFHSLWLPLRENEVRQSLGFLLNAEKRPERLECGRSLVGTGFSLYGRAQLGSGTLKHTIALMKATT